MYAARIRAKIEKAFAPCRVTLIDRSARHAAHAGVDAKGETHFYLEVVSPAFTGKNRLERQRLVYGLLRAEMNERVHALSLRLKAPGET